MKLRNKKTGEIGDIAQTSADCIIVYYPIVDGVAINPQKRAIYTSLDQLNAEWEDYEEPKERWYIDEYGKVWKKDSQTLKDGFDNEPLFTFETREEAIEALEKLEAWKRLRDKGFKFTGFSEGKVKFELDKEYSEFTYNGYDEGCEWYINGEVDNDLELLFGGEK